MKALFCSALCFFVVQAQASQGVITGEPDSNFYDAGLDLHYVVSPQLEILPSYSSMDNIKALSSASEVSYALVQSDVLPAFRHLAQQDADPEVRQWASSFLERLRVIIPLFDEDIYFLVRENNPAQTIADIRQDRIFMDAPGSDNRATGSRIFQMLFHTSPQIIEPEHLGLEHPQSTHSDLLKNALKQLSQQPDPGFDVLVIIGTRSRSFLQSLPHNLRILPVPHAGAEKKALLNDYHLGFLARHKYPFLTEDLSILTVPTYLITEQFQSPVRNALVKDFSNELCAHAQQLTHEQSPLWQSMAWSPSLKQLPALVSGWQYSELTQPILSNCAGNQRPEKTMKTDTGIQHVL